MIDLPIKDRVKERTEGTTSAKEVQAKNLMKYLTGCGSPFTTTAERKIVREVKEERCVFTLDAGPVTKATSVSSGKEESYVIPNDSFITVAMSVSGQLFMASGSMMIASGTTPAAPRVRVATPARRGSRSCWSTSRQGSVPTNRVGGGKPMQT